MTQLEMTSRRSVGFAIPQFPRCTRHSVTLIDEAVPAFALHELKQKVSLEANV
jgi:hypothetical protein